MPSSRQGQTGPRIGGSTGHNNGLTRISSGRIRISKGLIRIRKGSTSRNSGRIRISRGRTSRARNIIPRNARLPVTPHLITLHMEAAPALQRRTTTAPLILARIIPVQLIRVQIVQEIFIPALRLPGI